MIKQIDRCLEPLHQHQEAFATERYATSRFSNSMMASVALRETCALSIARRNVADMCGGNVLGVFSVSVSVAFFRIRRFPFFIIEPRTSAASTRIGMMWGGVARATWWARKLL